MRLSHQQTNRIQTTERARREGGYVLAMFGLMLVPLLLMAGFAVDIGSWYNEASDIQKAADAASLAGVVWLPDEAKARTVALDVAKRNGYDDANPNITVTVSKSTKSPRRLKVVIKDDRVGSFFYENLGGRKIKLSRDSFAEYITPVPMGSPRNFFGTGTLLSTYTAPGIPAEYLYQSVNPYCTDKENGDRYQSKSNGGTCSGTDNTEYRSTGYEMYIEAKAGRPADIEVRLYDPRYNEDATPGPTVPQTTCTNVYTYQTDPNLGWTGPATSGTSNLTITGPLQYQTKGSGPAWNAIVTLPAAQTFQFRRDRLRYRAPLTTTPNCVTNQVPGTPEPGIDSERVQGTDTYTYTLYAADNTPLDDTDNPQICQKSYDQLAPFDGYSFLGSVRWNTLCTISSTATSGKYILRVHNSGAVSNPKNDGSNQWGLVARYTNASNDGLCDGRTDTMCPRVYGKGDISVRAAATTTVASFYMAEIGREHAGKKLKLDLFDPGEGGTKIEIQKPTGTNTWESVPLTWTSTGASPSSGSGTSIDVTSSRFNGKLLEITVDLTGYSPPTDNNWWQIKYTFSGAVTDRTTWSARIIGDPVHLIEEN